MHASFVHLPSEPQTEALHSTPSNEKLAADHRTLTTLDKKINTRWRAGSRCVSYLFAKIGERQKLALLCAAVLLALLGLLGKGPVPHLSM